MNNSVDNNPNTEYIAICPWCDVPMIIYKENCCIFRHATYKNGQEVDPHLSKDECDRIVRENLVYGCGKPFRIVNRIAEKCEYI
jgi:hypothetical protein